ncbi:hypothetical protein JCM11641_006595 [Rhodosporidiobolus odoratus]
MPKTRQSARLSARCSTADHDDQDSTSPSASAQLTQTVQGASTSRTPAPTSTTQRTSTQATATTSSGRGGGGTKKRKRDAPTPVQGGGETGSAAAGSSKSARIKRSSTSTATSRGRASSGVEGDNDDDDPTSALLDASTNAPPDPASPSSTSSLQLKQEEELSHATADEEEEEEEPVDRLTPLSTELLSLILSFLVHPPTLPSLPSHSASPPSPFPTPDRPTLTSLALTCKSLLPHARAALYRDLIVDTRVQAHAVHRTLHGSEVARMVRRVEANVEAMARTSSQWLGWFLFHSLHSLCGIIGSCRQLLHLTLYLPADSSAWTGSLCQSLVDLKNLQTLTKDLEPSLPTSYSPPLPFTPNPFSSSSSRWKDPRGGGAGKAEGMDVGWRPRRSVSMWAFIKPLSTLRSLHTLRLCGISSDSSTLPSPPPHGLKLVEVVLVEVNITNTDLLHLLGNATSLEKFTLWRSSLLSKRGLTHVLKKCPKLVELRVGGSWFGAKEEDDKTFPLDDSLPHLPLLKTLFISGSLLSPKILTLPSLALTHLFVTNSPSWTPEAVHSGLVKMPNSGGVRRLTLPEMRDLDPSSSSASSSRARRGGGGGGGGGGAGGGPTGKGDEWNETWRFTVKKTGEAKGVLVVDRWRPGKEAEEEEQGGRERRVDEDGDGEGEDEDA